MPSVSFDRFPRYDELTAVLHGWAGEHPTLLEVTSIGCSHEGRDIWLCTVTNTATGPHDEKPALWVDASIHATELTGTMAALHLLRRLLAGHGTDPTVTRALDTRTFYVVPRLNPDGAEAALADRPRLLRSSTRRWPDVAGRDDPDGLVVEDVDGDGRILRMRVLDANGPWKVHPDEPRLLVAREPDDGPDAGPYYRQFQEGTIRNYDGVTIQTPPTVEGLDLNRNYPAGWRTEGEQRGAGPYPASEPEVRAAVQAVVDRPNVCGLIAYHTFAGALLRPSSTKPDDDLPVFDLRVFKAIGARGTKLTGYPALSVFHDFKYHPKEVITGAADDWAYEHLGVFAWTTEFWDPVKAAGIEGAHPIHWFDEHPVEDDRKLLAWNDAPVEEGGLGGAGFVDWYPFDHPQLGRVELGGWDYLRTWSNPPAHRVEAEVAPHADFAIFHALIAPHLERRELRAEPVGPDTWRVRLVIENTGWLPTHVSEQADKLKVVPPLVAELDLPDGAELVGGELRRVELGQLTGRALKTAAEPWWPGDATTDRAKVDWVVRAPAGTTIRVEGRHARAGVVRAELVLGRDEAGN